MKKQETFSTGMVIDVQEPKPADVAPVSVVTVQPMTMTIISGQVS